MILTIICCIQENKKSVQQYVDRSFHLSNIFGSHEYELPNSTSNINALSNASKLFLRTHGKTKIKSSRIRSRDMKRQGTDGLIAE